MGDVAVLKVWNCLHLVHFSTVYNHGQRQLEHPVPQFGVEMFHLYTVFVMAPKTTKSRLDRLLPLSFASLRLSKQPSPGMSFSVRTTDVEFEVAFAILQFCIWALRTFMTVQAD